jgi:hypothetical protein
MLALDLTAFFSLPAAAKGCRTGDWTVMARAVRFYGDDSGAHGKGTFVVSGYAATDEAWSHVSRAWLKALQEPPEVPYFHMGSNYHGDEPFTGWSETDRRKKREHMLAALQPFGSQLLEISSVIDWDVYREGVVGPLRELFDNPYFFCFHGVVSQIKDIFSAQTQAVHVSYTFDRESALEARLLDQFFKLRVHAPELEPYVGGLCFEDDKYLPGLQIADAIAWLVRRDFVQPPEDGGTRRPELVFLREHVYNQPAYLRKWRKDGLLEFSERIERALKRY